MGRGKILTRAQLDGLACVVCGADHRPQVPVPGVETRLSTHLFRCDREECRVAPAEVRRWVAASGCEVGSVR